MYIVTLLLVNLAITSGRTSVLILARGGSKGVRLKNIQEVGGISLLARTISTAKEARLFDINVSTDHPLIALEAIKHGAKVFRRSKVTASDSAPSIWGANEFLAANSGVEILALLQTTSPFTKGVHLRSAVEKITSPNPVDCVFSVTRSFKLRWGVGEPGEIAGKATPLNFDINKRPRRQDWGGELLENGAFYISRRKLIENGRFQNYK